MDLEILFENISYTAPHYLMIPLGEVTGEREDDIVLDMTGNLDADMD